MSVMFAATYPDRTTALVLFGSWSTWVKKPDYPWAPTVEQHERAMQMMRAHDPAKPFNLEHFAPSKAQDEDFGRRFARYGRLAASPGAALALYRMNIQIDVRPILDSIHVPTLVLQRSGDRITYAQAGSYLAQHIAGSKYVELPGTDHLVWVGDRESILGEVEEFLTGIRHAPETDRVLATIVFTDIVDSTARATALGDKAWKELLARHDSAIRRQIVRFRGREVKTQGDAFVITFDGPARAVRCAQAIIDDVRQLGLAVRIGIHAGEITLLANDIGGIAVHIAARVSAMAGANETLVSGTVRDLVAGSGITFVDRGVHSLKGLPEAWRIYAVGHD
jgi:class 3 adenylate cyclase